MIARCVRIYVEYFSKVLDQRCGKESSRLSEQWPWHVFLQLEQTGAHAPRFRGPARLGSCKRASNRGSHATQRSVCFSYRESSGALLLRSLTFLGEEALHAKGKRIQWSLTVNAGVATVV